MDYLAAAQIILTPTCIFFILVGVAVGMVVGTLPGLTSVMAVSLITPLTFKLDSTYGFAMLLGVYNSAIFSGGRMLPIPIRQLSPVASDNFFCSWRHFSTSRTRLS